MIQLSYPMKQILAIVASIFLVVTLIAFIFTYNQFSLESQRLENDIQYRSSLLADGLKDSVEPNFINKSNSYLQSLVERYADNQRVAGLAIVDNKGKIIAVSSSLPKEMSESQTVATNVMDADKADGSFVTNNGSKLYVYAQPLHDKKSVVGSLLIIQNAQYIDTRLFDIWKSNAIRILTQGLLLSLAVLLIFRWLLYKPIQNMVLRMRSTRLDSETTISTATLSDPFFSPLVKEVSHMQQSLIQARVAASEEARLSLEKLDSPWTAERLSQFAKDILKKRTPFVVSVREPYIHSKEGTAVIYKSPPNGVVTAVEPIIKACGGLWIAQGSGNADKLVVDEEDKIKVPPDDPKYTLKRIWLSEEEERKFYYDASRKGIYPLHHLAYIKPVFRQEDWEKYKAVNKKFAEAVLKEIKDIKKPIIMIQEHDFGLLPKMIKSKRPDAVVHYFWHIPWANAEAFSSCPWKKEILEGMLGADLLGFHTQLYCNNFIESVGRELEALIDFEKFTVTKNGHISLIRPFPASINFTGKPQEDTLEDNKKAQKYIEGLGIKSPLIGVSVDRFDASKGLMEKMRSIEIFFKKYPEYIKQMTFIQFCPPLNVNRGKDFEDFSKTVEREVERVNNLFKTNGWKPIVLVNKYHTHKELEAFYRLAKFCLITSLSDGMNLVSKEFVAARSNEDGILILSQFAGSSKELKDALIVNPFDTEQVAKMIHTALNMQPSEQIKRMRKLRNVVKNYNTYRWAAEILKGMVSVE